MAHPIVIDTHAHVISTDEIRYPRAPIGGHQSDWSRARPISAHQMIAAMDKAGVEKGVMVQASTCYGHDCSFVADVVAAHRDRFVGVFSADIVAPDATTKMKHWLDRGFSGMRLFATGSTMPGQASWMDDPATFRAWGLAEEAKLPVCLQMQPEGIPQIVNILKRFSKLLLVLDHLARPKQEDGPPYEADALLWNLARYPGVYVKATERNFIGSKNGKATAESFFGKVLAEFGPERILWGSNFPASEKSLGELITLAQDTLGFVSAEDKEWIFHRTARRLYPALGPSLVLSKSLPRPDSVCEQAK